MPNLKRKYKKLRWVSVDTTDNFSFHTSVSAVTTSTNLLTSYTISDSTNLDLNEMPPFEKEKKRNTFLSLFPKSTHYLQKGSRKKYSCPYYIQPKHWSLISNAPEFNEKFEYERIRNFYYHMHEKSYNPDPFANKNSKTHNKTFIKLASLPPIQKYKQ